MDICYPAAANPDTAAAVLSNTTIGGAASEGDDMALSIQKGAFAFPSAMVVPDMSYQALKLWISDSLACENAYTSVLYAAMCRTAIKG